MVIFRTDGNPQIGSGHIMRCLSLADAFGDLGQAVVFVTADDCFQSVIRSRGYECIVLSTEYDHMEDELPRFLALLQKQRPGCVLLDSYFVTPGYMSVVRREAPLVYIDDLNAFDYPANLVVNYTLYGKKLPYPKNKRYLLGPQYALLRKEFQNVPAWRATEQVRNVLLSTGGADLEHVALKCVQYLLGQPTSHIIYHVILGAMNQDIPEIERISAGCSCIQLHRNVTDMRSLMLQCDAAVSAGGTTLFELCACGLPTVTYVLADNQIMNAESFEESGLMLYAGDVRADMHCAERIFDCLKMLVRNQPLRQRMSNRMQALVNGNGAVCLAEELLHWAALDERGEIPSNSS